jgi:DNA-directed RNA polymerase subunit H (RpoH/RPB5)
MTLKELPFENQTFAEIIDNNLLYADKTKYIYDLLTSEEKKFFLARPYLFGKSLLISTLEEVFTGNRERFQGQWIDKSDYAFPKIPVISLNLSQDSGRLKIFRTALRNELTRVAEENDLRLEKGSNIDRFGELIQKMSKAYKSGVALLIDDYNAAILNVMDDKEIAWKIENDLSTLLETLERPEVSPHIHFILVTGITKFGTDFMRYGDSTIIDISLNQKYAGICGFTLDEFNLHFSSRMESTFENLKRSGQMMEHENLSNFKARIHTWYGGYRWGGDIRILNPYSILNFFRNNSFDNYWIQSARPKVMSEMIKHWPLDFLKLECGSFLDDDFSQKSYLYSARWSFLFHCGYLSIYDISENVIRYPFGNQKYVCDFYNFRSPNYEITSSLYKDVFSTVLNTQNFEELKSMGKVMSVALLEKDTDTVSQIFTKFFSRITYKHKPFEENNIYSLVQLILWGLFFSVKTERSKSKRRDMYFKLESEDYVVVEVNFVPKHTRIPTEEENQVLAELAMDKLNPSLIWSYQAEAVKAKLRSSSLKRIRSKSNVAWNDEDGKNELLAKKAKRILTKAKNDLILANLARKHLHENEIAVAILRSGIKPIDMESVIDSLLRPGAMEALKNIQDRKYRGD